MLRSLHSKILQGGVCVGWGVGVAVASCHVTGLMKSVEIFTQHLSQCYSSRGNTASVFKSHSEVDEDIWVIWVITAG